MADPAFQTHQPIGVRKKRWIVCFEQAILGMDLSIYEKMVYIVLCAHAKKDGPAFPSVMTIASEVGCSRTKVFEALNVLEERGLIARENRIFPKRGQSSNLYEIGDIEPRPQDGPGGGNPPPQSAIRTPESVERTAVVRHADAPLDVLEQDPFNRVIEQKDTPLTPQGTHTEISQTEHPGPEEPEPMRQDPEPETRDPGSRPTGPDPMTQRGEGERTNPETKPALEPPGLIEAILAAYNRILPELPAASRVTPSREKAVRRRIREEPGRGDPKWWERYFSQVREFPWLMGSNPSGWRACLDWLIGERGMLKVLEGGFGRSSPPAPDNGPDTDSEYELQRRFTNERGVVDVKALFRYLDGLDAVQTA